MANKTNICNAALSSLKISTRISSIEDKSAEADACLLFWDQVVDEVLTSYQWNFATFYRECEKKDAAPLIRFQYEHGVTNDVLRIVGVYGPDGSQMSAKGSWKRQGRSILTDEDGQLVIEAICRVKDCTLWSPMFVGAFVARLASAIGLELGKSKDALTQHSLFLSKISTAKTLDSTEEAPMEEVPGEWELAHL